MRRLFASCWLRRRRHRWHPVVTDGPWLYLYCRDCPAWKWSPA